jgi:hypothetical protein
MLTDSEIAKNRVPAKRRDPEAPTNVRWSDSQKIEAVTTFLMLGNVTLTAATLRIPLITLQQWRRTAWWKELEADIRKQDNLVLSHSLKKIVDKSLAIVSDRLENGDYIYDQKKSALVRKPVPLKDAHKVVTDFVNQQQKLITPEAHTIAEEGIKERLEKLAKSFEAFAEKQTTKPAVIVTDVIFQEESDNAVYAKREEGLQA